MTIKYGAMLDEYFTTNEMLRTEVLKLQKTKEMLNSLCNSYLNLSAELDKEKNTLLKEVQELKDYIKYTL